MEIDKIAKQLESASLDNKRSLTARIDDVLDDIEKAISSGVGHEEIIIILNDNGFDLTLRSFRDSIYRARKKRADKGSEKPKFIRPAASSQKATKQQPKDEASKPLADTENIDFRDLTKLGHNVKKDYE